MFFNSKMNKEQSSIQQNNFKDIKINEPSEQANKEKNEIKTENKKLIFNNNDKFNIKK